MDPDRTPPDDAPRRRRFSAVDAVRCVAIAAAVLIVCNGSAVSRTAERMPPGIQRDVVTAIGKPAGWIADRLPLEAATTQVRGWLSSDEDLGNDRGGFEARAAGSAGRVPPAAFSAAQLGSTPRRGRLRSLLVTGDSMSQPLDSELARRLARAKVRTVREPHIGTGISKSFLLDWGALSTQQARRLRPEAVVVFLGANEGFPMRTPAGDRPCCDAAWAAEYATRVRGVVDAYRRGGAERIYWLLLPAPRDPDRARVARVVNAAIRVAAGGYGAQVQVVDAAGLFTPGGRFRSAMTVDGRQQIVRNPDGIHLNETGAALLADLLERTLGASYAL